MRAVRAVTSASMAGACRPAVVGVQAQQRGRGSGGQQQGGALGQGAQLGGGQHRAVGEAGGPGSTAPGGHRHGGHGVVADQAADPAGGVLVVDAGADEFDGGRGPQFGHPGLAPHGLTLGQGLQDGDRQDAAGPVVGVQLGQVTDRCHGRGLVQDGDQGRVQPPAAGFGQVHPGAQHPVGQGRDQGGRGPAGVLAQQVEGAGPVDEPVGVQPGQWSPRWGDPGGDRRVAQAAGPGAGGEVDAGPGLVGHVRVPAHGPGEHVEPAGLQGGGRGGVVLVGQPFVDLGDRGAGEVGGQEQPGQQLGGAHRPDRVLLVGDRGDEVPGQAFGLLDGGDAGQGVPPPGLRGAGHALRVEHPRLQPGHGAERSLAV